MYHFNCNLNNYAKPFRTLHALQNMTELAISDVCCNQNPWLVLSQLLADCWVHLVRHIVGRLHQNKCGVHASKVKFMLRPRLVGDTIEGDDKIMVTCREMQRAHASSCIAWLRGPSDLAPITLYFPCNMSLWSHLATFIIHYLFGAVPIKAHVRWSWERWRWYDNNSYLR